MIVKETERILGTACDSHCIKEIVFLIHKVRIDRKVTLRPEVLIEMFPAYKERIMIRINMVCIIKIIIDNIRLENIIVFLKTYDPLAVHLVDISVNDNRTEIIGLFARNII